MEWSLIIVSSLLVLFSLYIYAKTKKHILEKQHAIISLEIEIKKLHSAEKDFKDEISTLQNKLTHTFTDAVTNLLGWKLFEDRLAQNIKESERYQLNMGVLTIDINDFKIINDALGYKVGDSLLKEVAERLQRCVRQVDSLSRFREDIFVVLLTQLSKPETAAIVAQRMLQALAEPFMIDEHELHITACIGIAVFPTDGQDAQSLLRNADHALHLAKMKGKHVYQFYQEKLHSISQRELTLLTNLNRESIYQELVLYYQPVLDIHQESIICFDVLLHWQHSEIGEVESDELFFYAEKQRKLNMMTEWLLQTICRQLQHWQSLGFNPAMIGIPISFKQLENSHFIYRTSQILQEYSLDPKHILFEIKDSGAQLPSDVLDKAFNMLKFIGVKIALDHFGSGNFPLHYLKNFPIQYLRLDKTLIDDVATNEQTVLLIKSLVTLAKNLGMQLIIQGIESDEQINLLKELNCTLMQGNLLGAPLVESEVTKKMTTTA